MRCVDVVVVGDGIAGCAAAIALAQSGVSVGLARQATSNGVDIPETLAPMAMPLLKRLGLNVDRVDQTFPRIMSRLSRWGRGPMQRNDMLPRPAAALLLGKQRLIALLWSRLGQLDYETLDVEQIAAAGQQDDGTVLHLRTPGSSGEQEMQGRMVIDATGRAAAVAHKLGVRRRVHDSLVSFWIVGSVGDSLKQTTVTATVHDGWIFYVGTDVGRGAVGFFTAGSHISGKPTAASIVERARGVAEIAETITSCSDWAASSVTTRNAATTTLERPCGPGWIACGDALQTVDPLASSGNLIALKQGLLAAEATKAALFGDRTLLNAYAIATRREFREVLAHRSGYYGLRS
jgi:2-polyprenyl-6-methoxyphenol hydroxylase-like FAD-dependent oxidoreductase